MFFHMYKYKLKSLFRKKEEVFWIMIFPLILGTFFFLAFSKVSSTSETFQTIDIAVVCEDNEDNQFFKTMMENMYTDNKNEIPLFKPNYTTNEEADKLLADKKVTAIITLKNATPAITIKNNGVNETVVKTVMDRYLQMSAVIANARSEEEMMNALAILSNTASSIVEKQLTKGNTDNMIDYYYALIAMACMFATLSGQTAAKELNANLSPLGMRKSLSPRNKLSMILSDTAASFTLHLVSNAILICYLQYILKLNLGGTFLQLYLVTILGSLIAMSIGILVGSANKISEGAKVGINLSISLFSSFLSGLMVGGIKNVIEKNIPIINRLNPSALISDAIYALNIYDDYKVFTGRLIIMLAMTVVFVLISFLMTRREKYDSI